MSVKPIPPADVQLEHLEEKYAQIRHAMGQVVTSLRIPRECGFALIMALMDMSSVVAKDDGIGHEALQRVLSLWHTESDTLPDHAILTEAFGPVTQPTEAEQVQVQTKRDAVWLGNVVPAGRA